MWLSGDRGAIDGGVGGDDTVDLVRDEGLRHAGNRSRREIGRNLYDQRRVLAMRLGKLSLFQLENAEQAVERGIVLKLAQSLRVRRRDVDCDIARERIH